jgi:hypothetical protein
MYGETAFAQSFRSAFGVGCCGKKVATEREKNFTHAFVHCFDRFDCVAAMLSWRLKVKLTA